MIDAIGEAFEGVERVGWEDLPPASGQSCRWPSCTLSADLHPLVSFDGAEWWCLEHGDNSRCLPPLEVGPSSECEHCARGCAHWINEEIAVHPYCLRPWMMGKVGLRPKGAYARRR